MEKLNNLIDILKYVIHTGNGIIFISGENEERYLSYEELFNSAKAYLSKIQKHGIKEGDQVIFQLESNKDFIICFWACILGKVIPIPVSIGINDEHKSKIFKIWEILDSPYLISDKKLQTSLKKYSEVFLLLEQYEEIVQKTIYIEDFSVESSDCYLPEIKRNDIAFIQFSSGSTGTPKGVVLTHENLLTNIHAMGTGANLTSNDVSLSWMPLTHDMGLIGFHLTMVANGMKQYIMPTSLFIRRPILWIRKINEHRVTVTSSPNFGLKYFLTNFRSDIVERWDLSCIRLILNGAEPISAELCDEFLDKLNPYGLDEKSMFTVYGLAEASLAVAFPLLNQKFRYVYVDRNTLTKGAKVKLADNDNNALSFVEEGFPVKDCFIRICNDNNDELSELTIGRIQIKGNNVTKGYYKNEEATQLLLTSDGWLNTGDMGFINEGKLVVTGREKDIIFINGQNYYPHDIERIAEKVNGAELGKVVACGVNRNNNKEESVVVFVYFKKDLKEFFEIEKDIRILINEKIGLEVASVIPIRNIPKTTSGKIQRYKLAEIYMRGDFVQIEAEIHENKEKTKNKVLNTECTLTENILFSIYKELLPNEFVTIHDNFFELGATSFHLTLFSERIDEIFPGKVKVTDLFTYPTISRLAKFIDRTDITSLPNIQISDEFLNPCIEHTYPTTYLVHLEMDMSNKIKYVCEKFNINLYEYLLSIQLKLLSNISDHKEIAIQVMLDHDNCISNVYINFNEIKDYNDLFRQVKKRENNYLSASDLENISLKQGEGGVYLFFYNKALKTYNYDLASVFNMITEVVHRGNTLDIYSDVNTKIIDDVKIHSFYNNYYQDIIGITEGLYQQYDMN